MLGRLATENYGTKWLIINTKKIKTLISITRNVNYYKYIMSSNIAKTVFILNYINMDTN